MPIQIQTIPSRLKQFAAFSIVGHLTVVIGIAAAVVLTVSAANGYYRRMNLDDLLVEAHGMLFDLLLVTAGIVLLGRISEKRQRIERYTEELDDYRGWEHQEARYRGSGLIRRLYREGIRRFDLSHYNLPRVDFDGLNLAGSDLSSATLTDCTFHHTNLERADCNHAKMSGSILHKTNLSHAYMWLADLSNATLHSVDARAADLKRVNFEGAEIVACDFRGASLDPEDLLKARSLYLTALDEEVRTLLQSSAPALFEMPAIIQDLLKGPLSPLKDYPDDQLRTLFWFGDIYYLLHLGPNLITRKYGEQRRHLLFTYEEYGGTMIRTPSTHSHLPDGPQQHGPRPM